MSSDSPAPTPQDDADRIRLKRLAKLQTVSSSSSPGDSDPSAAAQGGSGSGSNTPPTAHAKPAAPPKPKPIPRPTPASVLQAAAGSSSTPPPRQASGLAKKKLGAAPKFDLQQWEHETVGGVLKVTLDAKVAESSGYEIVWLKHLAVELQSEGIATEKISLELLDRLLIARLELDPQKMTDELDYLPVLVSLPPKQTIFEYLVGCWKRLNAARSAAIKKGYTPLDTQNALERIEKIRHLVISYAGYILQEPEMFPQPNGRALGPPELITPLLSLSALSAPLLGSTSATPNTLTPSDIEQFMQDLARRFAPDNELDGILEPVVTGLCFHESLFRPEGLGGGDTSWRGVISGLEVLVGIKSIAAMITRMDRWNPKETSAVRFEREALLGPLCRLGVFPMEWPGIGLSYFSEPDKRSRDDVESSFASLRGTLKSLQSSLFQIFNTLVRAGPESREAVLDFFARVISLNAKRAGMQVDQATVASDSFMFNIQTVLYRFAEPFIDANYTKMDRIDRLYFAQSTRIDLKEETRIKATSEEAQEWEDAHKDPSVPPPNFISDIFYLTIAMTHYGYLKTISSYNDLNKHLEDIQRHLDFINGDGSWMGSPMQARTEAAINKLKSDMNKIRSSQLAYEAGLLDPEVVFRSIGFTNFLSTWLIRQVDPKGKHPSPIVELPLPTEVPMAFRVLPEYIVEDIVEYLFFAVQTSPDKFELSGKLELMTFVLTFLTSTWYIKNPFLKSKINDALFMSIWQYGRERNGILGNMLNTHPLALAHLMPAMMHFYIEVEQTGASSQFYDKFNARRSISYILKTVWNNPSHREALKKEAKNVDKFVRFVNLMINDVTYLMDESLGELIQIHNIQVEMSEKDSWEAQTPEHRREREGTLRQLERHASSYITLGRSTVELLKVFTAETKEPFMMPEIVDRLAAMLDYNLQVLVGPKSKELKVKDPKKYKFDPRALLSDVIQVFMNLSDQQTFINSVAGDGRSYSKELFDKAATTAVRWTIKTEAEIQVLRQFVEKVEIAKASLEAEEDLGEVPDEYLDPLMFTVMKDPVLLPSSKTIIDRATIKSHLLSDSKDPFNRAPLSIEQVVAMPELKAQIEEYLVQRRNKSKILETPAIPVEEPMDTSQ
ncbi:ubiquitin elongating factor core-domain-containing protein [Crepidotus variabilis]|uniref:RING-type E3 ubiquitin transferase n=1 Tax=Crepidotus variabilis TaxID=179855 RepID=A0A9P6EQ98_9AGAR|nr:ubiquitin elongating factor core-domain-containing protein [Crepidotus variabilis]